MAEDKTKLIQRLTTTPVKLQSGKTGNFSFNTKTEQLGNPFAGYSASTHNIFTLTFSDNLSIDDLEELQENEDLKTLSDNQFAYDHDLQVKIKAKNLEIVDVEYDYKFLNADKEELHNKHFPEEVKKQKEREASAQDVTLPNSNIQIKIYPDTYEGEGMDQIKVLEAKFPEYLSPPSYVQVAETISHLIKQEESADNTTHKVKIKLSFQDANGNPTNKMYLLAVNLSIKFNYSELDEDFSQYALPSSTDQFQRSQLLGNLMRKYESSLLLCKLTIKEWKKAQEGSNNLPNYTETIHQALNRRPGRPGILGSENNVDPESVLEHIITTLRNAQLTSNNDIITFLNQTSDQYFNGIVGKFLPSANDSLTRNFLKEFETSLRKLYQKEQPLPSTTSTSTSTTTSTSTPKPKNTQIEQIMRSENYTKLIERIEIIRNRKNENSSTYKTDLLKMQGILDIERAFNKALEQRDDATAFKTINTAITDNRDNISAYSGWFSQNFFSFFHRDCHSPEKFFTHGYKSTSDELLNGLSEEISRLASAATGPQNIM